MTYNPRPLTIGDVLHLWCSNHETPHATPHLWQGLDGKPPMRCLECEPVEEVEG